MSWFAIYNKDSGLIKRSVSVDNQDEANVYCLDVDDLATDTGKQYHSHTYYINSTTTRANLRDMTPCTPDATTVPADGTSPITLSYLRPNTHIRVTGPINGETTVTEGGSDTLTFARPGKYTITATAPFPAKPKEIVINAS